MFEYLAILDFEATCDDRRNPSQWDIALQEIIEIPVALIRISQREVVATFDTFVRPTKQALLTQFCTKLTSIQQHEVDAAPPIGPAVEQLLAWLNDHDADAGNTLLVTCGDWDLKSMWPRQSALAGLATPRLFKHWANLKRIYTDSTDNPPASMMGMLRGLDLTHEGHHHRGKDDVRNLANVAVRLLEQGTEFRVTWTQADRSSEFKRWESKANEASDAIELKLEGLAKLPSSVPEDVRLKVHQRVEALTKRRDHYRALGGCFSEDGG